MINVGLIGYGKAGQAVADVLRQDPRFRLRWVARHRAGQAHIPDTDITITDIDTALSDDWIARHPIDALVDFSVAPSLHRYADVARQHRWMVVSAISAYQEQDLALARALGADIRIMCSPNITLGINFLILASRLLRTIAPFADVEILEQHFREKPEVSGTARKIASSLDIDDEKITSLRLGGIVGHHEVIFGFPYQTVRIIHNSIRREAFGTGAAFALEQLALQAPGFYTFDDLMMNRVRETLLTGAA